MQNIAGDNVMAHPCAMRGMCKKVSFLPSMWCDLFKGLRPKSFPKFSTDVCHSFERFDLFKGLVVKLTSVSILLREFCYAKHRRGIMWWHIRVPCVEYARRFRLAEYVMWPVYGIKTDNYYHYRLGLILVFEWFDLFKGLRRFY